MNVPFHLKNWRHWIRRALLRKPGGAVTIGAHTYGAPLVRWWGEPANLSIGKFCSIADNVEIFLGGNHRTDWITTYPFPVFREWREARRIQGHPATRGDVRIGHDVWLGSGSVILSGVTIGHGAVVGCRAVVSKDVPPYSIVAGNPAIVVRTRFSPDQTARLLRTAWWDWEPSRLRNLLPLLLSGDIERFLASAPPNRAVVHPAPPADHGPNR